MLNHTAVQIRFDLLLKHLGVLNHTAVQFTSTIVQGIDPLFDDFMEKQEEQML